MLHAASLSYNRLTAGRTGPLPRSRRRETNADGNRDTPREIGAGLDIRVDARAERGDGDAHNWGVVSVAATVARRCTWREPNSMASAAAATVTAEPVSDGAARGSNTHSTVAVGRGADVPDIPEIVSELSGAAIPRQHARHAVVGVEVQDVFEDDTDVAGLRRARSGTA